MKKIFMIICFILSIDNINAADKEFMDFLLKHIEKRNFVQCTNGIESTFDHLAGTDVFVNSESFDETIKDSFKI